MFRKITTTLIITAVILSAFFPALSFNQVSAEGNSIISLESLVKKESETAFTEQIDANFEEVVDFKLKLTNTGEVPLTDVFVSNILPANLSFVADSLSVPSPVYDGELFSTDGLNVHDLDVGESMDITFKAKVAFEDHFDDGETILINSATAVEKGSTPSEPVTKEAKVKIVKNISEEPSEGSENEEQQESQPQVLVVGIPLAQCLLPNSLGDNATETIYPGTQGTLQERIATAGYQNNVSTDQKQYQNWVFAKNSTTFEIEYLGQGGGVAAGNIFGYYLDENHENFVPVFRAGNQTVEEKYNSLPIFAQGQKTTITINSGTKIAFGLVSDFISTNPQFPTNINFVSTENSKNSDSNDHAVVYDAFIQASALPGDYIIGFEDRPAPYADNNFNDVIVRVHEISCENISAPVNTPPTITLIGANPLNITVNTPFVDPGATANDAEDGNLTSAIVKTGSVNASTTGTYTLTYSVTDLGGLAATTTRQVIVSLPNSCVLSSLEFYNAMTGGQIVVTPVSSTTNTASFTVTNNTNCSAPISMSSYKVFTLPYTPGFLSTQELIEATPLTLVAPQTSKTFSVAIASCMTQVDGWYGEAPTTLPNSGESYLYPNVPWVLPATLNSFPNYGNLCTHVVNTPPTITLIGANPLNITVNTPFVDPGATANDAEDGNLTSAIVKTGSVNASTTGSYTLTYVVKDSGNLYATTTRVVNVNPAGGGGGGGGGNVPTIPTAKCFIPDSLGDITSESIGISSSVEKTLQQMLSDAGYANNVTTNQKQYQRWGLSYASTTIEVEFIDQGAGTAAGNAFGYYLNGDKTTFVPLFRTNNNTNPLYTSLPVFVKGQKINVKIASSSNIAFAIDSRMSNQTFSSTENVKNLDTFDHVLVYEAFTTSQALAGNYILGFEDLNNLGDTDYNDVVVRVRELDCGLVVPVNTPPTITLIGANPLNITVNTPFVDPGATANDAEDGNLTSAIVKTGSVNASTTGSYTLTYVVKDSGNLYATTTRVVNVNPVVCTSNCGGGSNTPTLTLNSNPGTIDKGASSTLAWTSTNTSSCSATWTSATSTSGSASVAPATTTDYAMTCTGSNGSVSATTTVVVNIPSNPPPVDPPGGGGGGGGIGGRRHPVIVGEILGATSCSYLRDYLKIDWQNDPIEVLKLQSFLNVFEKENLSLTGVFDQTTFAAVERFQTKYRSDILEPWGDKVTTGFVYILTKKKINEIYCNTLLSLNQADRDEIEAFRNAGSSASGNTGFIQASGNIGSDLQTSEVAGIVIKNDDEPPIVVLKDKSLDDSIIRNAAISLFAIPQKLFGRLFDSCTSASTLLFLILIALLVIIAKLFMGSRNNKDLNPIISPTNTNEATPIKDSPVIILPGVLPDEEIVIEDSGEDLENIAITTPDLRDSK